jgi:hypothetical protein
MEISSNRINPYPLAVPEQRRDATAAAERRYEQDKATAEKRSESGSAPGELIRRGESVQERTGPDYSQVLQRARLAQAHSAEQDNIHRGSTQPRVVQQALSTYRELSTSFEYSGIELLPRIDDYA